MQRRYIEERTRIYLCTSNLIFTLSAGKNFFLGRKQKKVYPEHYTSFNIFTFHGEFHKQDRINCATLQPYKIMSNTLPKRYLPIFQLFLFHTKGFFYKSHFYRTETYCKEMLLSHNTTTSEH